MRWPLRYQIMVPMAAAMLAAIVALSLLSAYLAGRRTTSLIERQVAEGTFVPHWVGASGGAVAKPAKPKVPSRKPSKKDKAR